MKKNYYDVDCSKMSYTRCNNIISGMYFYDVKVGSLACQGCKNYISKGNDNGDDYVLCNNK